MIQRIQTVFLFLVGVCMILFLIFPVWELNHPETGELYKLFSIYLIHRPAGSEISEYTCYPYSISGGLALISIILAFVEILKYKNRLTQIKIGMFNALIIVASLILLLVLIYFDQIELMPEVRGRYLPGLYMPAAALVFNSLANRFIRRDEKLVRSVDRIR
jgi:hypothetical protein